ncbi:MAG: hypothetical protein ACE5SW_09045 [Nitrososphaeraceae archaeon]
MYNDFIYKKIIHLCLVLVAALSLYSFGFYYNNSTVLGTTNETPEVDNTIHTKQIIQQQQITLRELLGIYRSSDYDEIPQIYPSAPNGEEFTLNKTNPNDMIQVNEVKNKNIFTTKNDDDSWRIDGGRTRIDIFTKDSGIIDDNQILDKNLSKSIVQSWNFSELKEIGYWHKPTDWKNVEITLIFKFIDSSRSHGEDHSISLVTRSISHSELYSEKNNQPSFFCGGSSYHNNISNDGQLRMKKEHFHANYERDDYNNIINLGNIYGKIIGYKTIVYNLGDNMVKLETWVDIYNEGRGPYVKLHEKLDSGDWGDSMKICGGTEEGQAITWGSPMIIIKANDFKFDIYDIEIREIIPQSSQGDIDNVNHINLDNFPLGS